MRSAGDRVILGSRSTESEQEWGVRQKIAECTSRIIEHVQDNQGIVVRRAAESVFSTFPSATTALDAACNILESQAQVARNAMEQTNSAPLGLRLGLTYGKMMVNGGQVSGDAIDIAGQLAGRASSGQLFAAESIINALGDRVQKRVRSLGSMDLDDIEPAVEIFEIQWHQTANKSSVVNTDTALPASPKATPPAGPSLRVQNRGKEIVLDTLRPAVTLRGGKEREPHAKIELREDDFYLINLKINGTRVRIGEGETLCLDELLLKGKGAISLGLDFKEGSPEVLIFTKRP